MKSISQIIEYMDNTLEEAEDYYRDYLAFKEDCPKLSSTALEMAKTHLDLYMKWHTVVTSIINDYKVNNGEAPETMKAIWNYEHERLMEDYNELKYKVVTA